MKKSFTLAEILISALVLTIVSLATYTSLTTLSRVEERSRDTFTAHNLVASTYEGIKARAYRDEDFFNNITSTYPVGSDVWEPFDMEGYPDGFFERQITVEHDESPELEHIRVSVRWMDQGDERRIDKAFTLARPPDPLPGNIAGTVSEGATHPVQGVLITIQKAESGLMISVHTDTQGYYTFENEEGNYQLSAGTYSLSATHEKYKPVVIGEVIVNPDESTQVDIQLEPLPQEAKGAIRGKFVDPAGRAIPGVQVRLYSQGQYQREVVTNNSGIFQFNDVTVEDEQGDPIMYTVATRDTYRLGYCGHIPNVAWAKQWHYMGWSSSLDRGGGSILAGNPWWGSLNSDRIGVVTEGITDLGTIVLYPVPTATISGTVRYQGVGMNRAVVSSWWHNWQWWGRVNTNTTGQYSIVVPAAQELFPENDTLRLRGSLSGNPPDGCGYTPHDRRAPPLYAASQIHNFDFDLGTRYCGNIKGRVRNDLTLGGVPQSSVSVQGQSGTSNALGNYCVPDGGCGGEPRYTVPTGNHALSAQRNGYYPYSTQGNTWYAPVGGGNPVTIRANETTEYNFRMFPQGYGDVRGVVLDSATSNPVSEVTVSFRLYDGNQKQVTTQNDGEFTIDSLLESWPPETTLDPADGYYNHNERLHSLEINAGDEYEPYSRSGIIVIRGQTKDLGNIFLIRKGQM
ncbi:MAG: carboxypeptidase regulatory-like domain-containing protein [Candidatus Omnitrophica bacterium]|nr:carboxypeptidase regulatory-like domain-containing protein [Candidatus Omnitrophota bacterium]